MSARLPAVSVVMAVRDGGPHLSASLESVLAQRHVELELIVVDDGSTDETAEVLARGATDPRVRILSREPRGLTHALSAGCDEASAPLIARQDAGDLSHPDRLAAQLALVAAQPSLAFVSCATACVGPLGEPLYVAAGGGTAAILDLRPGDGAAAEPGPSSHGSVLFRREAYRDAGGYRTEFALAQDWDLWYRLSERGRFASVDRTLYLRRLGLDSLSFAAHDLQAQFREAAREAARLRAAGASDQPALRRAEELTRRWERERAARRRSTGARGRYHLGALLGDLGDPRGRHYLAAAALRRPWSARTWWRWLRSLSAASSRREPEGFSSAEARELIAGCRSEAA